MLVNELPWPVMDRIVADPAIMGGVPCVRGTRIPAATIAGLLAENLTVQEVLEHYPQLTAENVQACQAHGAGRDQR